MIQPQIVEIKRELLEMATTSLQKEALNVWFNKYVTQMTVQEVILDDQLLLVNNSASLVEHVRKEMFAKMGEGLRESGLVVEETESGCDRYGEELARQMKKATFYTAKVFILGAK
jgi:hypothetical protein